ncbi:hypothetical protein D3C72_315660 [compost metagenome]
MTDAPDPAFKMLLNNAVGFLNRAIRDAGNRPNALAIGVYTAIELVLKARLAHEHWSLMVTKSPNRTKFEAGDFVSVSFDDACIRLRDIVQEPLPDETREAFDDLRKIRNRLVHFSPPEEAFYGLEAASITTATRMAALKAWYLLVKLMKEDWKQTFEPYALEVEAIEVAGRRAEGSWDEMIRNPALRTGG